MIQGVICTRNRWNPIKRLFFIGLFFYNIFLRKFLIFRNEIVDRMVNIMMVKGKKQLIRTEIYGALEIIKRVQYKFGNFSF